MGNIPSINPLKLKIVCACFKSTVVDQTDGEEEGDSVLQPETPGWLLKPKEVKGRDKGSNG